VENIWTELKLMQSLLAAFVLSGLIGWEREQLGRGAGLRTYILIGVSAALFVVLADTLIVRFADNAEQVRFDLVGVLGAVVSSVSFLGAGAIFSDRQGEGAKGLTTAAGMLATAGVGVACGLHLYVLATGATLLFLFTLGVLGRLAESKNHPSPPGPSASGEERT